MNLPVLFLILALTATACSRGSDDSDAAGSDPTSSTATVEPVAGPTPPGSAAGDPSSTTSSGPASPATGPGSPTTTARPVTPAEMDPARRVPAAGAFIVGDNGAAVAARPGGPVTGRLRAGVALAVDAIQGAWAYVLTPCENRLWVRMADGHIEKTADVVIDPGHGGGEPGAVGPAGLAEKDLNFAVSRMAVEALRAEGVNAALARTGDYRQTLASRVAIAAALEPKAFVSIHHNAAPDESWPKPGTETYYQTGKSVPPDRAAQSKRLAGLIYEEVVKALSAYPAAWVADRDAGAKYRLGNSGDDYYGILRRSAASGMVASLAELAFVTNPSEEALLQRDDVRRAEADAVARGILRFLRTEDPGSGFTTPYPREEPAGGGGGPQGCVDPT